ncbi:MAG: hypothetical protein AAF696_35290 [Bacteroidota bacterium]
MSKKFVFFILLFSCLSSGYSQRFKQLSASLNSEAIGLPFSNYSPIHPGIEISGTLKKNDRAKSIRYWHAKAGFFQHERLANAIYLGGEYQYSQKLFKERMSLDLPLGLGYLHTFYPGEIYEQNEAGDFESINQVGRAHLYLNLGIGLTYLGSSSVQPFIRQELMLQTPFANGIPVIPHSLLKFGIQIKL